MNLADATSPRDVHEATILAYALWQGDETPYTIFRNKFVNTRKPHECCVCQMPIPVGSRVRAQTERDDDDSIVMTFYVCPDCGQAMWMFATGENYTAIENRYNLKAQIAQRLAGMLPPGSEVEITP